MFFFIIRRGYIGGGIWHCQSWSSGEIQKRGMQFRDWDCAARRVPTENSAVRTNTGLTTPHYIRPILYYATTLFGKLLTPIFIFLLFLECSAAEELGWKKINGVDGRCKYNRCWPIGTGPSWTVFICGRRTLIGNSREWRNVPFVIQCCMSWITRCRKSIVRCATIHFTVVVCTNGLAMRTRVRALFVEVNFERTLHLCVYI